MWRPPTDDCPARESACTPPPERSFGAPVLCTARNVAEPYGAGSAAGIAKQLYGDDKPTLLLLTKGAVSPASLANSGWAGAVTVSAVGDFIVSLAPMSAAARLIEAGTRVSLSDVRSVMLPRRSGLPSSTVAWVEEGAPHAVRSYVLSSVELAPKKLAVGASLTNEMVAFSDGETVVRTLLAEDAAASLDKSMFELGGCIHQRTGRAARRRHAAHGDEWCRRNSHVCRSGKTRRRAERQRRLGKLRLRHEPAAGCLRRASIGKRQSHHRVGIVGVGAGRRHRRRSGGFCQRLFCRAENRSISRDARSSRRHRLRWLSHPVRKDPVCSPRRPVRCGRPTPSSFAAR